MTHGRQLARSDMEVNLNGEGSSAQIVSRSVGRDAQNRFLIPRAVGNQACAAHIQCDSIIMDQARIRSIPEIAANHAEAQIVHEAAIGRINNDQLVKLMIFWNGRAGGGRGYYSGLPAVKCKPGGRRYTPASDLLVLRVSCL